MASPALIDPRANYALVLSQSPPESGRVSSTITSTSGSVFNSTNGTNTVEFLIPPVSMLDTSGTYLTYTIRMGVTPTVALAPAGSVAVVALDNVPAMAPFATARLYNSENVLITEITDLAQLALHRVQSKGIEYASFASQCMGYTTSWSDSVSGRANNAVSANDLVAGEAAADTDASRAKYPARVRITTADGTNTVNGEYATFAIPLEYFSGVFGQKAYLPLKYSGSRANAFRLELTTSPVAQSCVAFGVPATVAGATGTVTNLTTAITPASVSYQITDIKMVVQYTNLGAEVDANIARGVNSDTGLQYIYDDWTSRTDSAWTTAGSYNTLHPKYSISLKSVVVQLRDSTHLNNLYQCSISGCRRYGLTSLQTKLGPSFYPNAPVQFNQSAAGFNGHAFMEWSLSSGSALSNTHQAYSPSWNTNDKGGWEFALDYDRKQKDSSDINTVFTGKDTRSGSSQVEVLMNRAASTAAAVHVTVLFNTDNVLIINKGNTYALERS
jgi:hypothetical protein